MVSIEKRTGEIVATEDWNGLWGVLRSAMMDGNMLAKEQKFLRGYGEYVAIAINSEYGEFVIEEVVKGEVVYAKKTKNYWKAFKEALILSNQYGPLTEEFFRKVGVRV